MERFYLHSFDITIIIKYRGNNIRDSKDKWIDNLQQGSTLSQQFKIEFSLLRSHLKLTCRQQLRSSLYFNAPIATDWQFFASHPKFSIFILCVPKWTIFTIITLSQYDHYDCFLGVKLWSYLCDILVKIMGIVNFTSL